MKSQVSSISRVHRLDVLEALESRYGKRSDFNQVRLKFKMIAWYFIVYFSSALKRFLDILGAGVGLITFFPVLVVVAFFIYAHDKGGVIFVQKRVGRWG